jgi:hypothetical protein
MQINVAQHRRYDRSLDRAFFRPGEHLPFKHAYMQTLSDKPHERPVRYPFLEHLQHGSAMNRVEKGLDVCLEDHIRSALPHCPIQRLERIVGAALGAKTKRTVQKFLLIDSTQYLG